MDIRPILLTLFVSTVVFSQQKSITGTVTRSDNSPVEGVIVVIENTGSLVAQFTTDAAGAYTLSVPPATYSQLRVRNINTSIERLPRTVEHTAATNVTIDNDTAINIKLPSYINIHGMVVSSAGDTIRKAAIEAKKWNMGADAPPWDNTASDSITGSYSIYQEAGSVKIWVTPPGGLGVNPAEFILTLTRDTLLNLILPKSIMLSGTATNRRGDTLRGIGVTVEIGGGIQVDSFTNANGRFVIPLNPGTFNIRLRNMNRALPGTPSTVEATVITGLALSRDTVLDLLLPFYPMVRCSVVTDIGVPAKNVLISAKRWIGAEQPPWDFDSTDANGLCTLFLATDSSKLWISPPTDSGSIPFTRVVFTPRDTTISITLIKGVTLSGTVRRADDSIVRGIMIAIEKDADQITTSTDIYGHYSINLQSGTYRLRVRNMNAAISGIPQTLEHTVMDTMVLLVSRTIDITLPLFPVISGVVMNAAGNPQSGVQISAKRWIYGAEAPPWAQFTTMADGAYSIIIGKGINKVWITPPSTGTLGAFDFIENFDTSVVKNIYIADKARGIKRIQPSVVSTGQGGGIMINGIGCDFSGTPAIDLGEGISVTNVKVISSITLTADITVAQTAKTGSRDILVTMAAAAIAGPNLLTITPPASDTLKLDNQGKTMDTVVISDGTGTELMIPKGTLVTLPAGSDSIVSFVAPIIKDTVTKLSTGEFTDIQRELGPSGLTFGDTVVLTSAYKTQDIEGLDESTLTPFYFTDGSTPQSGATVGDSMPVIERDTVANTLSFGMTHFSMFRLASAAFQNRVKPRNPAIDVKTRLFALRGVSSNQVMVRFFIAPAQAATPVLVSIINLRGRVVAKLIEGVLGSGTHTIAWDTKNGNRPLAGGQYFCVLTVGKSTIHRQFVIIR